MYDQTLISLRKKARQALREQMALRVFFNANTDADLEYLEKTRGQIDVINKRELRRFIDGCRTENEKTLRRYGARATGAQIVKMIDDSKPDDGEMPLIFAWQIRKICSRYDRRVKGFDDLPSHAAIAIDPGDYRRANPSVEIYWLEATAFEDMCALFNLWKCREATIDRRSSSKVEIKTFNALGRAAAISAFNFLEAYLNGLALDYLLRAVQTKSHLSEATKEALTEWDDKRGRERFVNFRDKLIKYPRIVADQTNTLLDESNCEELSYILSQAKLIRDSVVHPSARSNVEDAKPVKLYAWFNEIEDSVERIVDSAITLVRKIDTAIRGTDRRLSWLIDRGPDGLFPEKAFC